MVYANYKSISMKEVKRHYLFSVHLYHSSYCCHLFLLTDFSRSIQRFYFYVFYCSISKNNKNNNNLVFEKKNLSIYSTYLIQICNSTICNNNTLASLLIQFAVMSSHMQIHCNNGYKKYMKSCSISHFRKSQA